MHFNFKLYLFFIASVLYGTGTQFLVVPANGIELASGANAVHQNSINPASVFATGPGPRMNVSYGSWLAGSKISAIKILFPGQQTPIGIDLKYVDMNDLELRTDRPTDDPLSYYGASGFSLGGSFSKGIMGINMGTALRYVRIDLYTENSSGFAADIGITKKISPFISIGSAVLNIGKMSALRNEVPELPLRIISTVNFIYDIKELENNISISGEWSSQIDRGVFYLSTASIWKNMAFRMGSKISKDVKEFSGGISLKFGMYGLNYGVRFGSQNMGLPQMIDLTILLP